MQPMEGFRVLDLTHVLAGPFCTYQLAVQGADVIKIESPHQPDMTRVEGVDQSLSDQFYGTYFQAQNGGKRAITLDLTKKEGQQILRQLIKTADVLVQNFSGDKLAALGFGPEAAQALNPKLIYCSMTGFGRTGPKAHDPAYDNVIQSFSGLMSANVMGEQGAVRIGPPVVDYGTGAQAALAITGALLRRERTGDAQIIDVSMLDCAMMLMSEMVAGTLATGQSPGVYGNDHPKYAGYRVFQTADEPLMIGAFTNAQLARLLKVLGEDEQARLVHETARSKIPAMRQSLVDLMQTHFSRLSASYWENTLNHAHIPAARVRKLQESLQEAQINARAGLQEVPDPLNDACPAKLPVAGYMYAEDGPALHRRPPQWGEHTDEVLNGLGYDAGAIAALRKARIV